MIRSLKYVALLALIAMVVIFAYGGWWMVNQYHTSCRRMHTDISEALRRADYRELDRRVKAVKRQMERDSIDREWAMSFNYQDNVYGRNGVKSRNRQYLSQPLSAKASVTHLLQSRSGLNEFGLYLQRGVHTGVDGIRQIDMKYLDCCLTDELHKIGIGSPYRLYRLYRIQGSKWQKAHVDTLDVEGRLKPTAVAETFELPIDLASSTFYRLELPSTQWVVLRQMAGIIVATLLTFLLVAAVLAYLLFVIRRQRTLDEMKTDFTNNMTHELKTPIAVAYAANDALLNFGAADNENLRRTYLEVSQQQLEELGNLVEQILAMSMERRKTMRIKVETISVADTVNAVCKEQRLKADKPLTVTTDIPEDMRLCTDRAHFMRILSNLIDNAVKYSEQQADVSIHASPSADGMVITVTDHGIGIAKDKQRYIFDKFYRVPHGDRQDIKGYGLGLYYVWTMMLKLDGKVAVRSDGLGKGTTFTLTFYTKEI